MSYRLGIDVDGTLVSDSGRPNLNLIDFLKQFKKSGAYLVAWSNSGGDYAKREVIKIGQYALFDEFALKEDIFVDASIDNSEHTSAPVSMLIKTFR